ncbi:MAG: IS66 family transposase, partial [Alteraurantiacibacter sp.]
AKAKGGQRGHQGKTLAQVNEPDEIVLHMPENCDCCGRVFAASDLGDVKIVQKRQVFDLPPAQLVVTEHQLGSLSCCGVEQWGRFPNEVTASVQYGSGVNAVVTMLSVDYRLPTERITNFFSNLYGYALNSSTVLANLQSAYEQLALSEASIKRQLLAQKVVHFDETGVRSESKLHWLHTASTVSYTHLFVHEKRGRVALESAASVLKDFTGIAVHDCWSSYFKFIQCRHALCGAHLLRELSALIDNGSTWATLMHAYLLGLYRQPRPLAEAERADWLRRYQTILFEAELEEPPPKQGKRGRPKCSLGRALLHRLRTHQQAVLTFAFEADVPFTNNQAERDVRPAKVKLKVSGGFRTFAGAEHYARIAAIISTLRKQGMNVFTSLRDLFALRSQLLF